MKAGSRTGAILVILFSLLVVGIILFLSLQETIRNRNYQSWLLIDSITAGNLGIALLERLNDELQMELQSSNSELFKKIKRLSPSECEEIDVNAHLDHLGSLKRSLDSVIGEFENAQCLNAAVRITGVKPLDPNGCWKDPVEKSGAFKFEITVKIQHPGRKPFLKNFIVSRQFRVVNLLPGVLGRFSLFVKKPDDYNKFENYIDGSPVDPWSSNPFIVYNNFFQEPRNEKNGAIFLGGDYAHNFHLTSGEPTGGTGFGEFFHFYPFYRGDNSYPPPSFVVPDLNLVNSFIGNWSHDPAVRIFVNFGIQAAFLGFFRRDSSGSPGTMNPWNVLDYFFERTPAPAMNSSALHLFGTYDQITPAGVMGNVYRSYPVYTCLKFDIVPTNDSFNGVLGMMPNPRQNPRGGFWAAVNQAIPFEKSSPPTALDEDSGNRILLDAWLTLPEKGYRTIFWGDQADYLKFASFICSEPYNFSNRHLFGDGNFPPKSANGTALMDLNPGLDVSFSFQGSEPRNGEICFQGNLNRIPGDFLKYKPVISLSYEEFLDRFVRNGKICLRAPILINSAEPISFPNLKIVESRGMIVAEGAIHLRDLNYSSPLLDFLSICSLKSDVFLNSAGQVDASLIALSGGIINENDRSPLEIFGQIAAERFPVEGFLKKGGILTYNSNTHPFEPGIERYDEIFLADEYESWETSSPRF